MSDQDQLPQVELPGYELIEKIGAGGYGEVWSAIAPGGMRKAVKFVFGNEYDKRATSELHALEKIKAVRHPFLLSLERIEVVDGRLIVVSELADGSLRDRFCECVEQGLPGIPREELLGYLRDASDALDYIGERHDLAHLDIKPENLLLVAGHVKVADFGLVKSLNNQSQASLVGGMTPTYAAPEVFRGTPSRQSDQYSLAILYQEMLTGSVPFPGINAAELTLQHMKDDPDLARLPETDRFPTARALSKDPAHRFESCNALVEAIRVAEAQGGGSAFGNGGAVVPEPAASLKPISKEEKLNRHSVTEVFAEHGAAVVCESENDSMRVHLEPLERPEPVAADAPEVDLESEAFTAAPAVFIGIGGTGARVLKSLRSQMVEHLGADGPLASAPMLLLDTDPQTLATATSGSRGLEGAETVSLPLRRPQEYRDKADLLLRWLGRRWLYNIPRTLRTEGIRPLGRLALVDHARQAFQRIRGVLMSAIEETSREASADAVGLPFGQPGVRVYVVGSVAGAAGSGMSLDVAYAVRSILARLGVEPSMVMGVMTHSTFREATRCELARVNAYSWLCEFERHRSSPEGYPGDTSVGLPAHEAGVAAFDHTYFVPMGERIDTPEFESTADAIAEYLYADAFTPNQRLLDACREATPAEGTLRSFAVRHRDGQADLALGTVERVAVGRMIDRWLGGEVVGAGGTSGASTDQVVHGAVAFLGKTQLDSSTLASNCRSLLEASLGGDASAYLDARFTGSPVRTLDEAVTTIDACFGVETGNAAPTEVNDKAIETIVTPISQKLASEARNWVMAKVNDTQERLDGAGRAVTWLQDYLAVVDSDLLKVLTSVATEQGRLLEESPAQLKEAEAARCLRTKFFRLRLDQAALLAARRLVATLQRGIVELPHELESLHGIVAGLRAELNAESDDPEVSLAEAQPLSVAIEQRLQTDYLTEQGGLLGALSGEEAASQLPSTIAHAARVIAREQAGGNRAAADAALIAGFAEPPLVDAGGEYRRLTLTQSSTVADGSGGTTEEEELLLVTEMAGVSLPHVAAALINGRRDYAAFAERVRTRRDVVWSDAITGGAREEPTVTPAVTSPVETSFVPAATALLS